MKLSFDDRLLSRKEAAEFLGVHSYTLASWACRKKYSLPVTKVGSLAKYRLSDLIDFINQRTVKEIGDV